MTIYLVSRVDFRGSLPIKMFLFKESANVFVGECNTALKLIINSENPEKEFDLLKSFDTTAIFCDSIKYEVEEIFTE